MCAHANIEYQCSTVYSLKNDLFAKNLSPDGYKREKEKSVHTNSTASYYTQTISTLGKVGFCVIANFEMQNKHFVGVVF